jgi:hypothetical protein
MSDVDANALNEQLKATAAAFNAQHTDPTLTDDENAARVAAADLGTVTGSLNHDGVAEIQGDTPESLAAKAEADKKAAAVAAAAETPEQAAVRVAEEALAAARKAAGIEEPATTTDTPDEGTAEVVPTAEWITTESKEFNASLGLMRAAGMTPTEAAELFNPATSTGDLSKVDQAALVEKVGEDKAALIMAGFTTFIETEGQAALAATKAAHDAVGGSANWARMVSWARGKAATDAGLKAQVEDITLMLNSGNAFQADMAASKFKELFNADKANSTITKQTAAIDVTRAKAAPSQPTIVPLSMREFAEQSLAADRLRGPARAAKLAALSVARAAGRAQGL